MPHLIHLALNPPGFNRGGIRLQGPAADHEPAGSSRSRHDHAQEDLQQFDDKALNNGHGDFSRQTPFVGHVTDSATGENSTGETTSHAETVGAAPEEAR